MVVLSTAFVWFFDLPEGMGELLGVGWGKILITGLGLGAGVKADVGMMDESELELEVELELLAA